MIAVCLIRDRPEYRREAFVRGLAHTGHKVVASGSPSSKEDLFVIWNRYGGNEVEANRWERLGGTVVVCENGYIGKDERDRQLYAISVHGHNGSGWWPTGDTDRFGALGIDVKPWRTEGEYILVCGQRGIGSALMASPVLWHEKAATRIQKIDSHPIKLRLHPGRHEAVVPLNTDLSKAHAVAIWSSSSGVKALVEGIPVVYDAPRWIASDSGVPLSDIGKLCRDDEKRKTALHKMAWAQWTVDEILRGEPFARIKERLGSASW